MKSSAARAMNSWMIAKMLLWSDVKIYLKAKMLLERTSTRKLGYGEAKIMQELAFLTSPGSRGTQLAKAKHPSWLLGVPLP